MKFSKRGKTRIRIPAIKDTSGESAININNRLAMVRPFREQTPHASQLFDPRNFLGGLKHSQLLNVFVQRRGPVRIHSAEQMLHAIQAVRLQPA